MANNGDRLDRIERILEEAAKTQEETRKILREMAARQQYHDEAFERFDAEMKVVKEAIAANGEHIRSHVRVAELHHERLNRLEGDEEV